jgi:hypothetical protein
MKTNESSLFLGFPYAEIFFVQSLYVCVGSCDVRFVKGQSGFFSHRDKVSVK